MLDCHDRLPFRQQTWERKHLVYELSTPLSHRSRSHSGVHDRNHAHVYSALSHILNIEADDGKQPNRKYNWHKCFFAASHIDIEMVIFSINFNRPPNRTFASDPIRETLLEQLISMQQKMHRCVYSNTLPIRLKPVVGVWVLGKKYLVGHGPPMYT